MGLGRKAFPWVLSGLLMALSAPPCLAGTSWLPSNPAPPVQWLQVVPLPVPGVDAVRPLGITIRTDIKGGFVDASVTPLTRAADGTVLPADRLVYQNPASGAFETLPNAPLATVPLCQVPVKTDVPVPATLGIFLQPTDLPGTYTGTITFRFSKASQSNDNLTMPVTIEISSWATVSVFISGVQVSNIPIVSATMGPHDDLLGQAEIVISANNPWTLRMSAGGDLLRSGGGLLNADQVLFSLDPSGPDPPGPWTSLPLALAVLATGTGDTAYTLYFRITDPVNRQGGTYLGGLTFEITSP